MAALLDNATGTRRHGGQIEPQTAKEPATALIANVCK